MTSGLEWSTDRARQMLASHVQLLAQKSPVAARKTKKDLMNAIHSLSTMQERFPFLDAEFISRSISTTGYSSKSGILILYQIKDQTVYVD
ncbi:hypothetical protein Desor_4448 [Desulfosporosinus orientis DSM 765]|uniref:Plasmid stabilization system protein n=1 Tax=Desulfosporosinus orientis (strain ATCC 19365 / DSM 765 / NCIMB 8382 / VKM B-1628 / Singapore I) TaxID=768706 RepID=G7W705_DESOD|nr:hypothetical protein Desor_4448 [Desulfosporosinus orientis DSM 765]